MEFSWRFDSNTPTGTSRSVLEAFGYRKMEFAFLGCGGVKSDVQKA